MTDVLVKPAFQSGIVDTGDTSKLGPNAWNAPRVFSSGSAGQVVTRDLSSATGASWIDAPFINVQTYGAVGDGLTDDTAAFQAAIAALQPSDGASADGWQLFIPEGRYLLTDTLTLTGRASGRVFGVGVASALLNNAAALKPTFNLAGAQFFVLENFAILGDVGFPNDAIAAPGSGFGRFSGLFLCPNGNGIHLSNGNTFELEDCQYWPSGYNAGATKTGSLAKHAVLLDGSFINDVHIVNMTASGYTTVANGGSCIKVAPSALANSIHVTGGDLEGSIPAATSRVFEWSNVGVGSIRNVFIENTNSLFLNCDGLTIDACDMGNTATLTFGDGTAQNACNYNHVARVSPDGITVTANCYRMSFQDCVPNTFTDSGTGTQRIGGSVAGLDTVDKAFPFGLRTWDRSFADGVVQSYVYSATDFTASTGTWTVDSGDITTLDWSVSGKKMTVTFTIDVTVNAGGPTAFLQWKLPNSYVIAGTNRAASLIRTVNNGTTTVGEAVAFAGLQSLYFSPGLTGGTWANAIDTAIRGEITFWIV